MTYENYKAQLDILLDEADFTFSDNLVSKLARRAEELEKEIDFEMEDILEELLCILPSKFSDDVDVEDLLSEFADFVFDEIGDYDTSMYESDTDG